MSNIFHNFKQIPRPYLGALLSGILVGTSYIPFPGWALLFCYIPLWLAILKLIQQKRSLKKIFFAGWITQFALTVIGFNWIYFVSSEFGHLPWYLSSAALILFASTMHIYIPLALVLAVFLIRQMSSSSNFQNLFIMALCQALLERIWPSLFEWNLAYSLLWMKIPLFQWADTVGFWGLSTWILLLQASLAYAFLIKKENFKKSSKIVGSVLGFIILFSILGYFKGNSWSHFSHSIQFAVTQGNIGNAEKIMSEKRDQYQSHILKVYADLTDKHLRNFPKTEIVLWPETALPLALDSGFLDRPLQKTLLEKVRAWNIVLLTGAYSQSLTDKDHLGYPVTRNSIFYIGSHNDLLAPPYNKTSLLAFGEYMPLGEQFPYLYQLFPFVGVYERGPGPSPEKIHTAAGQEITLGPQICYESLDPQFSRGLAKKGADILFNVTNDSWFGWWAEPFQNNIMSLARAIEVRRPLIRSTNTGISSAILANGDQLEPSPIGETWAHTYNISYVEKAPLTFYVRFGHWDWLIWLLILGFLFIKGKYVSD